MRVPIIYEVTSCAACPYMRRGTLTLLMLCEHPEVPNLGYSGRVITNNIGYPIPNFCPEKGREKEWVQLLKDPVLADLLEERGYGEAANELRNI